ncbi:MAG: NADH-quinone oxidoreductase subunit I [Deltaproteobacteria bacterium]|nr:NADH-quinone oxidoreductase subunit I [Deltaproteobacteria bacterium]
MDKSEIINVSGMRPEKGKYVLPFLKGLAYTLKNFFSKPVTLQYPTQKTKRSERWRGLHRLNVDESGKLLCVACGLCAAICPPKAITIIPYEDEGGTRYPEKFVIDELRCIFCGFCQEVCPKGAISLTGVYDYVDYNRRDFIFDIEKLKKPETFEFKGK